MLHNIAMHAPLNMVTPLLRFQCQKSSAVCPLFRIRQGKIVREDETYLWLVTDTDRVRIRCTTTSSANSYGIFHAIVD